MSKIRFQTGEIDAILKSLKDNRSAEVEIDFEYELEELLADLEENGMASFGELDLHAVNTVDNPDFFGRLNVMYDGVSAALDIYMIIEEEEDYDEIFWG